MDGQLLPHTVSNYCPVLEEVIGLGLMALNAIYVCT